MRSNPPLIHWVAIYEDGSKLEQFPPNGAENKYTDIDRTRIREFLLFRDGEPSVIVHLSPPKQLIYRRRVAKHLSGPKAGTQEAVYLAGWQERKNDVITQKIHFLFEDGHVEVIDKFEEKHPWFYSVIFREEEKV